MDDQFWGIDTLDSEIKAFLHSTLFKTVTTGSGIKTVLANRSTKTSTNRGIKSRKTAAITAATKAHLAGQTAVSAAAEYGVSNHSIHDRKTMVRGGVKQRKVYSPIAAKKAIKMVRDKNVSISEAVRRTEIAREIVKRGIKTKKIKTKKMGLDRDSPEFKEAADAVKNKKKPYTVVAKAYGFNITTFKVYCTKAGIIKPKLRKPLSENMENALVHVEFSRNIEQSADIFDVDAPTLTGNCRKFGIRYGERQNQRRPNMVSAIAAVRDLKMDTETAAKKFVVNIENLRLHLREDGIPFAAIKTKKKSAP
jgi:hypothetical protein